MAFDWAKTDRPTFERTLCLLLERKHEKAKVTFAPDGRGGDGGVDFLAKMPRHKIVYQFKHYLDGFKSSTKSRKHWTKDSFEKAVTTHQPRYWVLVVPSQLTPPERDWVEKLEAPDGLSAPRIQILDLPKLELLLSKYPDIVAYLDREDILDQIEGRNIEVAEARNSEEVVERAQALAHRASNLDPDWAVDIFATGEETWIMPRAKHPKAAEKSPLGLEVVFDAGRFTPEIKATFDRFVRFGSLESVLIPRESIVSQKSTGPSFQWGPRSGDLLFEPVAQGSFDRPLEIELFDSEGASLGSHQGQVLGAGKGTEGATVKALYYQGLTMNWMLPSKQGAAGSCDIDVSVHRLDVRDARDSLALNHDLLTRAHRIDISVDGNLVAVGDVAPTKALRDSDLEILREFTRDFQQLLDHIGTRRIIPLEITPMDRVLARAACRILDGQCVFLPAQMNFNTKVDGDSTDPAAVSELRELVDRPHAIYSRRPDFALEIAGLTVRLGPVGVCSPSVTVKDGSELLDAIQNDDFDGRTITFVAGGDAGWRAAQLGPEGAPPESWAPTPWSLYGIEEHRAFSTVES
ncbi:hypothetical protein ABRQ22_16735 [Cellulosimicrobium sp. ES-005]|uniref:Restriction endonuclease type IV Mrr domain-containing protein n=1 Tax=Cellulosimicrobium sp. ES-005 TaxID=3163031 RepID=A0AAU8FZ48_9MICO